MSLRALLKMFLPKLLEKQTDKNPCPPGQLLIRSFLEIKALQRIEVNQPSSENKKRTDRCRDYNRAYEGKYV